MSGKIFGTAFRAPFRASIVLIVAGVSPAAADVFEVRPDGQVVAVTGRLPGADESPAPGARTALERPAPAVPTRTARRAVPSIAYASLIEAAAARHGLDPALVDAIAYVESRYRPAAVSPAGAVGFMQIMPSTAAELGVKDLTDPRQNIEAGAAYLRAMLDAFDNNIEHALAAYNAGPTAVRRHGGVPPFRATKDYVRRVLDRLAAMSPADTV